MYHRLADRHLHACTYMLRTHPFLPAGFGFGGGGRLSLPDKYFSFLGDGETMGSVCTFPDLCREKKAVNLSGFKSIMLISLVLQTAEF